MCTLLAAVQARPSPSAPFAAASATASGLSGIAFGSSPAAASGSTQQQQQQKEELDPIDQMLDASYDALNQAVAHVPSVQLASVVAGRQQQSGGISPARVAEVEADVQVQATVANTEAATPPPTTRRSE